MWQGAEPLEYQWFRNGEPLELPTAATRILCISRAALEDAGTYMCLLHNEDGTVESDAARLIVDEPSPLSPPPPLPAAVMDGTQTEQDLAGDSTQTEQLDWAVGDATQTEQAAADEETQTLPLPIP